MNTDNTRWTFAPIVHCALAARMGWEPLVQTELRGGVAFCPRCGHTRHPEMLFMDGRPLGFVAGQEVMA
jgi:hypothetical protein